jgi:hypothetical protein
VFCKGNPAIATQAIGAVEFGDMLGEAETDAAAATAVDVAGLGGEV